MSAQVNLMNMLNRFAQRAHIATPSPALKRYSVLSMSLLSVSLLSVSLLSCGLTRESLLYDACIAGDKVCEESCNGFDDDADGAIDEGLTSVCAVLESGSLIKRSGVHGGFGRAIKGVGDLDGDGYSEVLISATRAPNMIDITDPLEGEVSLVSGQREILWTVRSGGDLGASLAVGQLGSDDEPLWCAGAPSVETAQGFGRVLCLNFAGEKRSQRSSAGDFGLGRWLSTRESESGGDLLVMSEPRWTKINETGPDVNAAGRLLSARLVGDELILVNSLIGSSSDQRIGERVIAIPDVNDDREPDWLMTGYPDASGQRQVWVVEGTPLVESEGPIEATNVRRLKRFSTPDATSGSFGDSLAVGRWHASDDRLMLAFGAPYVEVPRGDETLYAGRVYINFDDGETTKTDSAVIKAEGSRAGLGVALESVKLGDDELLITVGSGVLRVLSIVEEEVDSDGETLIEDRVRVHHEFTLQFEGTPTLGVSPELDVDGLLRVWIGYPESETVQVLTLRPSSAR